jgi:Flp pilus assembly protein TadB
MTDPQPTVPATRPVAETAASSRSLSIASIVRGEWPYLLILVLAIFGVAWTSVARQPMTYYWLALAPVIGVICVVTRWHNAKDRQGHMHMIVTQALHWGAVLIAMHLAYVADVNQMMNADARALFILSILSLGTFTAGVHVGSWQICLVGVVFAAGVPAIAWLEQAVLLIVVGIIAILGVVALFWWHGSKDETATAP